eukprot:TRINITY_DN2153_c1_g1_i1.p3 TRINITY_DN2153_c1_g1~~TRINITY_DN2153_c1_g1_i1.p3  ORF type:complete len:355 (-),score=34.84 TRINITY_DN2153_c1_g1_i1:787-1851(-)
MSFKQLFTGGACQPTGERFVHSANPLTTFVDSALVRPMATRQLVHAPVPMATTLEAAFNQPLPIEPVMQHPAIPQARPYDTAIRQRRDEEQLNAVWDAPVEKRLIMAKTPEMASPWFRSFETFAHERPRGVEEKVGTTRVDIKGTADEIIKEMENSANPKFRQSKFLKFLRKVKCGAYTVNPDNTLTKHPEQLAKFRDSTKEESKESIKSEDPMEMLDKYWEQLHADIDFEYFVLQLSNDRNLLSEMKFEGEDEDQMITQAENDAVHSRAEYTFAESNSYINQENCIELAKKLISEEKLQEAIIVLQAEVQQNPASSEGWCLLGQLHAENDEDEPAVACLLVNFHFYFVAWIRG